MSYTHFVSAKMIQNFLPSKLMQYFCAYWHQKTLSAIIAESVEMRLIDLYLRTIEQFQFHPSATVKTWMSFALVS